MVVVVTIAAVLLVVAAVLAVVRIERGPSMLDRTVAFDVLTTTLVGTIAVEAAWSRRTETIPILVVLSLVGFLGSVVIARFAARESDEALPRPAEDALAEHEERATAKAEQREAAVDSEHHGGSAPGEVR